MTQHTPGPWEVRAVGVHDRGWDAGTFVGQVGSGLVAKTFTNKSNMQPAECLAAAQADASLIAAAPELLAACEAARYELNCLEPRLTDEFRSGVVALRESIAAAIAKAKGQL